MRSISVCWLLVFCGLAWAGNDIPSYKKGQSSDAFFKGQTEEQIGQDCARGPSTLVINYCEKRKFEVANRAMDKLYRKQLSALQASDPSLQSNGLPVATPYFIAAHKGWLAYRDSSCIADYLSVAGGTLRAAEYYICLARITTSRIGELSGDAEK